MEKKWTFMNKMEPRNVIVDKIKGFYFLLFLFLITAWKLFVYAKEFDFFNVYNIQENIGIFLMIYFKFS